jgi:DNA-binding XRE family transcriptional regulator
MSKEMLMKSNKLRETRKALGLTQEQVANKAGINRATYSHIESGRRYPSFKAASGIALALSKSIEDLFLPCNVSNTHNLDN